TERVSKGQAGEGDLFASLKAVKFDHDIRRLRARSAAPVIHLPTLAELQAVLKEGEVFIGYTAGLRICVNKTSILSVEASIDPTQFMLDTKILTAALTAQNATDDALDSQYPVAA